MIIRFPPCSRALSIPKILSKCEACKKLEIKAKKCEYCLIYAQAATEVTQNEKTLAIISVYFYQHDVWMR